MGSLLIAFPSQSSVEELLSILGGCPFKYLDPSHWVAIIHSSNNQIPKEVANPGYAYRVEMYSAELWYDEDERITDLVLVLKSDDIIRRAEILTQLGYPSSYSGPFVPYMKLVQGFPPLSRANKSFVKSISMSLRSTPHNFVFTLEAAVDSDGKNHHEAGMRHFASRHH